MCVCVCARERDREREREREKEALALQRKFWLLLLNGSRFLEMDQDFKCILIIPAKESVSRS